MNTTREGEFYMLVKYQWATTSRINPTNAARFNFLNIANKPVAGKMIAESLKLNYRFP